ncbi:DUF1893 domain-containing protein [Paludicola sp. MB14-C6]|uniref:DUF1893 domain-containing protein n=1 Tax=Paludihabitans sp. MB14-C6 TaxID=3070656 RepID=UPI0027DDFD4D|nr:DUF1893 domain-containing protein [Paludicola sp. MB14-C6]WMJ22576.1 DUF1893 domain-containing protein [Paludicola sp. MB14-C6]
MQLQKAINILKEQNYSCVVIKDDLVHCANGIGVKPIMQWLREDEAFFANAYVADKVIGKAAALLLVMAKAKSVYGKVMSESAIAILEKYHIRYEYDTKVSFIANRTNTGMCPLEQSVVAIDAPNEAYIAIQNKIAELMSSK